MFTNVGAPRQLIFRNLRRLAASNLSMMHVTA